MALRNLSDGQQVAFWVCACALWWVVTRQVQPPETARVLLYGVPLGVFLARCWAQAARTERWRRPTKPEPPAPPFGPEPEPEHRNGGNGHGTGGSNGGGNGHGTGGSNGHASLRLKETPKP